jgi:hypothetical protein
MEPVRLTPPLGQIARQILMNARDHHFAMSPLAMKAIAAMQVGDLALGDDELSAVASAWFTVLGSSNSAFFGMLARQLGVNIPLRAAIQVASGGFIGDIGLEGYPTVAHKFTFGRDLLQPKKSIAFAAMSSELVVAGGAQGQGIAQDVLQLAIRESVDGEVHGEFASSACPGAIASGTDAVAFRKDTAAALQAVFGTGQPVNRASWLCSPAVAIAISCLSQNGGGALVAPDMSISGGSLYGAPVLVGSGFGAHDLVLVDGGQIAIGADVIGLDASNSADFSAAMNPLQNATSGQGEALVSSWQNDLLLMRAMTRFVFGVARPQAVYVLGAADAYTTAE